MPASPLQVPETLSPWWPRALGAVMVLGFAVLILLSLLVYQNAPPVPAQAVAADGEVVFTSRDVEAGQAVFLKYGLMDNGTIWGHGGYLGPDFSAQTLHGLALRRAEQVAQRRFQTSYAKLGASEKAAVDGAVASAFKTNAFDAASGSLTLPIETKAAFDEQVAYWSRYFIDPAKNGGLSAPAVTDPVELRQLTAFFVWTAWAAAAERPGTSYSYTNNFPYDPLVGNRHTGAALLWSAISLIFLLGGIATVLLAFGKFDYLGWHGGTAPVTDRPASVRAVQRSQWR